MSGKTQGRRAAIYSRKSTDDGGDGRSIDAQLHDCHALAKAHGYEVVETYNEGTGVSASHLGNQERSEYRRALDDFGVEYDCLIGWAMDRLTRRGAADMAELFDLVEKHDGRVLTRDYDSNNEAHRILGTLVAEMARAESDRLGERIRRGKEEMKRRQEHRGGPLSFGLKRLPVVEGQLKGDVVRDDEAAALIQQAAEDLVAGKTTREVARWMSEKTGKRWGSVRISRMFRHPSMLGHRAVDGDVYRDEAGDPIEFTTPILTPGMVARTDRVLRSRYAAPTGPKTRGMPSLLGKLGHCHCGGTITHTSQSNRNRPNVKTIRYYYCRDCEDTPSNRIRAEVLEGYIITRALSYLAQLEPGSAVMDEVGKRWLHRYSPEQLSRREELEDEADGVRGQLSTLRRDYYELTRIPADEFNSMEDNLTRRLKRLEDEAKDLPEATPNLGALLDLRNCDTGAGSDLLGPDSAWGTLEPHKRREILYTLVEGFTLNAKVDGWTLGSRVDLTLATESNVASLPRRQPQTERAVLAEAV